MELALLALLGAGILGTLFIGDSDDDDDNSTDDNTNDNPPDDPKTIVFDGSVALKGGTGNDIVPGGQDSSLAPTSIGLLNGNDTATIDFDEEISVHGGWGDDTLTGTGEGNDLYGNVGNDTMTGGLGVRLFGGVGDDDMTVNSGPEGTNNYNYATVARGGEGDDEITVNTFGGIQMAAGSEVGVQGDAGADTFNINVDLVDGREMTAGDLDTDIVSVRDFDPTEDKLVIEVDRDASRGVTVDFERQIGTNNDIQTRITLEFAATATADAATSTVYVSSQTVFGLDEIEIKGI